MEKRRKEKSLNIGVHEFADEDQSGIGTAAAVAA